MTRHPDWERRLNAVIERHRDAPGEWGVSDCFMLSVEAHEAVTGVKLLPNLRRYRSEKAGYRLFAKHGFTAVGEALASVLEPCGRLSAMRGDLGTIERDGIESCGVVTAMGLAVKTLYGHGNTITSARLEYHPVTSITRAFRVG